MEKSKSELVELLAEESATFEGLRAELCVTDLGRFAVIKGSELFAVTDTFRDGYEAGLREWGNVPMLVKEIRIRDRVVYLPLGRFI